MNSRTSAHYKCCITCSPDAWCTDRKLLITSCAADLTLIDFGYSGGLRQLRELLCSERLIDSQPVGTHNLQQVDKVDGWHAVSFPRHKATLLS